ncbi:hypothetical protein FLAG1_07756 [Fusarium langsethiae]|uniref:N-acetyltransferase domain-containing protein n=1 Tax=Fusarium langsethiae TaxID=179993 RepID=A0A0M9ETJ2_FUSLA|nr:hypothetical protein FLAG1_07756 [Fusarium langsethiae]GKU19658.1 unnamed protein product [Fusarium langsethiae]
MNLPKTPLKIVRISSLDEAYRLVDLACEAFAYDHLYALILPKRLEQPECFREAWLTNFREEYGKKGSVILAAKRESDGDFVAFAVWVRYGTSYVARSWQGDTWDKKPMRLKTTLGNFYGSMTGGPDPNIVSTDAISYMVAGAKDAEKLYPDERWGLSWLGVSPKCQRTGIGRRLAQWGIDRSEEEGVPAVLVSSKPGRALYEKLGFKEIGQSVYDKDGNTQPVMLRPLDDQGDNREGGGE